MKILKNLFQGHFRSEVWTGRYSDDCWSNYPDVGRITDKDVADFTLKHLKFWDRFDPKKVAQAGLWSQLFLFKVMDEPKKKNWKY